MHLRHTELSSWSSYSRLSEPHQHVCKLQMRLQAEQAARSEGGKSMPELVHPLMQALQTADIHQASGVWAEVSVHGRCRHACAAGNEGEQGMELIAGGGSTFSTHTMMSFRRHLVCLCC